MKNWLILSLATATFIILLLAAGTQLANFMEVAPPAHAQPDFSPDGEWVVHERSEDGIATALWIARPDGSGARLLTEDGSYPSWHPDGSRILFTKRDANNSPALFTIPATGGAPEPYQPPGLGDHAPQMGRWSPDGGRLTYVRMQAGPPRAWSLHLATGEKEPAGPEGVTVLRLTPDGRELYTRSGAAGLELVLHDPRTGKATTIGDSLQGADSFAVGGDVVCWVAPGPDPYGSGLLHAYDLTTGESRLVAEIVARPWRGVAVSPDGKIAVISRIEDARRSFQVAPLR